MGGWDGQRRAVAWRRRLLPVYIPYGCMAELDYGCGAPVYGNEGSLVQSVNRSWNIIVPRRRHHHHQGGAWYRPRTLPRCYKKEDKVNKSNRSKAKPLRRGWPPKITQEAERSRFLVFSKVWSQSFTSAPQRFKPFRGFKHIAELQNTFSIRMVFTGVMMIITFVRKLLPSA